MMRDCKRCGAHGGIETFRAKKNGGLRHPCRSCEALLLRENRPKLKATIKAWHQTHPESRRATAKKFVANHREKKLAHLAVQYRIRKGLMKRGPCERCGSEKTQAHHDDYSKRLEVRWLRAACHGLEHRRYA